MQCSSFLQYGDHLLVSRAANYDGSTDPISGLAVSQDLHTTDNPANVVHMSGIEDGSTPGAEANIKVGDYIAFGDINGPVLTRYMVTVVDMSDGTITIDRDIEQDIIVSDDDTVYSIEITDNAVFEAVQTGSSDVSDIDYIGKQIPILNYGDYEIKESSIAFASTDTKLKFIARNPGTWGNDIEIAIAKPADFGAGNYVFDGISLDDLYEYFPTGNELAVVIRYDGEIKETYTVSLDENAVNESNKSMYIEDVINRTSSYVFVKENTANTNDVDSYIFGTSTNPGRGSFTLVNGLDSAIGANDLMRGYDVWSNKEEVDVDAIIANELDDGASAVTLVDARNDCIAFIGAKREDTVGLKSSVILQNLINWRETGAANFNNMFVVATGNYLYMYNKYLDSHKWINCAGTVAGLRCETSSSRDSWWASAGLERGQIKGVVKIAFNPTVAARDQMYKRGINPIVSFAGQGIVMWGQKTLLNKPSSFDRVNIRSLFNALERSLSKMAKYQVMEFNDSYTRNRIISMIKPYLSNVKAGRGIQDFLVIN